VRTIALSFFDRIFVHKRPTVPGLLAHGYILCNPRANTQIGLAVEVEVNFSGVHGLSKAPECKCLR